MRSGKRRFKILADLRGHEACVHQALDQKPGDPETLGRLWARHRMKIEWLQQERLAHLGVMSLSALLFFLSFGLLLFFPQQKALLFLSLLLLVLTIAYVFFYYRLENGLHRLYQLEVRLYRRLHEPDADD